MGLTILRAKELLFAEAQQPSLTVQSWSSGGYTIELRVVTSHAVSVFRHTANANRSGAESTWRLPDLPIMVDVRTVDTPVNRGTLYVRVALSLGGIIAYVLAEGYVTDQHRLTWPPGEKAESVEGRGFFRVVTGTDPAAGVEWSVSVPTNARWRLIALRAVLVTDATVANRRLTVILDDTVSEFFRAASSLDQAASTSNYYVVFPAGAASFVFASTHGVPLPSPIILAQGYRIRSSTFSLQAGDNWSAPVLMVEEWLEE